MPQCPNCKKPIRGLRRYGRVTKRAAIDAAEKKFITHAQRQLNTLQERVNAATDHGDLTLDKSLHHDLRAFGAIVKRPPCQKAFEACIAVLTKAMGGRGGGDVVIDSSALPVPNSLFPYVGYFYLLSAQLSLLDARAQLNRAQSYASEAITHFVSGSFSQQAAEAKLLLAQILIRQADVKLNAAVKTEKERKTREREVEVVAAKANTLLEDLKKCVLSRHKHDIDLLFEKLQSVVRRARSATFYQSVSMEEMKAIKTAMRAEFRGSGHWYRCVNGHSYSIGECGMAMEQTRCPECGAPVGGANHSFVNGNDRDDQMEML
ncbi:hypothetical protein PHYBOEH_001383 [Phytophthora boehmeriae]|uniref:RZ-type domain-containing protein n=1 Tax=Phytophthora boehmeriae TaxID=109152 RepID=A0A8T1X6U2_9STRA|nr:hypothetical protein PHYBOEH_001383 [Phytophthora boehmeriae]